MTAQAGAGPPFIKYVLEDFEKDLQEYLGTSHDSDPVAQDDSMCVAVGGARGSGKTALLKHSVELANEDGVGVYFSASCAYDPSVFLSGLCNELAKATEKRFGGRVALNRWMVRLGAAATATGALSTGVLMLRYLDPPALRHLSIEQLIALLLFSALGLACLYGAARVLLGTLLARDSYCKAYAHAREVQTWTEFSKARTSASELALEMGKGIGAKGKRTNELALSERPVSELALVTEFRHLLAEVNANSKVLIAIDELDKVDAVDEVRGLFRRIKGVFGADAIVLVAVSDETVTQLGIRDPLGRDEIRNSFEDFRRIKPLKLEQIKDAIPSALGTDQSDTLTLPEALWVLTGSNLRECYELYERIKRTPDYIEEATKLDRAAFVEALESDSVLGEQQRSCAFAWAHEHIFSGPLNSHDKRPLNIRKKVSLLRDAWTPKWAGDERLWSDTVAEHWRCLLVRDILRSVLREKGKSADLDALNNAFYWSHHSAGIALRVAGENILTDLFNDLYPAATGCGPLEPSSLRARFRGGAGRTGLLALAMLALRARGKR